MLEIKKASLIAKYSDLNLASDVHKTKYKTDTLMK